MGLSLFYPTKTPSQALRSSFSRCPSSLTIETLVTYDYDSQKGEVSIFPKYSIVRPTLMGTKNYENGPNPYYSSFFNLLGTRMVQIRIAKSVWAFRNKTTNGFGAQIRLHQRYKTANGFRTRRNYYYIWPIILLELKYIMTSARNAAAIAKGRVELRSTFFYSREERARWRQGPRCLRCLKLRMVGGLGGLMMTPRRSSGCGACIP